MDCNGNAVDGCETNITIDTNNCGACGKVCAVANSTPRCASGTCGVASCNGGYADCNANAADGCETNITSDTNNCGRCGNFCGMGKACVGGTCQ